MSIYITCSNEHALRIKDKYAGKTRRCPICKAVINVPPRVSALVLKDPSECPTPDESGLSGLGLLSAAMDDELANPSGETGDQEKRICAKCCGEVPKDARVCPHCSAYVESLSQ